MTEAHTSNTDDLTLELAQVKARLQELEIYRWIVESSADFILVINRAYNVEFINRFGPDILGVQSGETSVLSFISPEFHKDVTEAFEAVLNGQEFASYRTSGLAANGELRWYESRVTPIHKDNAVKNLVLIAADI